MTGKRSCFLHGDYYDYYSGDGCPMCDAGVARLTRERDEARAEKAATIARLRVALERMALGVRESRDYSHVACTGWSGHRATPECPRAEGCPAWDHPGTQECLEWLTAAAGQEPTP